MTIVIAWGYDFPSARRVQKHKGMVLRPNSKKRCDGVSGHFEFILLAQCPGWHQAYLGTYAEQRFALHYSVCLTLKVGGFTDRSLGSIFRGNRDYYPLFSPGKKESFYLN